MSIEWQREIAEALRENRASPTMAAIRYLHCGSKSVRDLPALLDTRAFVQSGITVLLKSSYRCSALEPKREP